MNTLPKSFFELIATADKPILVDFWAAWCVPCQAYSPIIGQVAKAFSGRLLTIKVNVDERQVIASQYQIGSIPTVLMFWKGVPILRIIGVQSFEELKKQVEAHFPKPVQPGVAS